MRRAEIRDTMRHRIVSGLHLGTLKPGDRLPSARELAAQFDADPRVVVAAYRELERDALVEVRPRSGIYVARAADKPLGALPRFAERLIDVMLEELALGLPAPDFPERARRCLETVRIRAACIECNNDQIAALCAELNVDYGLETTGVNVADIVTDEQLPIAVRRADLLVTTSFHASEVKQLARRLEKQCITVALGAAMVAELSRLLRLGLVYFIATDARFAEKLLVMFGDLEGAENLRPVILGRDRTDDIPADAPVLVMTLAREQLGDDPLARRSFPAPRGLSRTTARQILTFVVRANVAAMLAQEAQRREHGPDH